MLKQILTKKRITIYSCACLILLSFFLYKEVTLPNCADAQTCQIIAPEVRYFHGSAASIPSSGCTTVNESVSFTRATLSNSPRNYAVALRGWILEYSSGDDNWYNGQVRIQSVFGGGNSISFNVSVCLQDDGPDRAGIFQGHYTAFAWENN